MSKHLRHAIKVNAIQFGIAFILSTITVLALQGPSSGLVSEDDIVTIGTGTIELTPFGIAP